MSGFRLDNERLADIVGGLEVYRRTGAGYAAGDVVCYEAFGGVERIVRVTEALADVKNGRAGFDGVVLVGRERGLTVWGYASQVRWWLPALRCGLADVLAVLS